MDFQEDAVQLINSDLRELSLAAQRLADHAIKLGGLGFGASFFGLIAAIAAMYVFFLLYSYQTICYIYIYIYIYK